ncbi:transcription initiation factor TFIID subunit 15b isoform X1 [Oryza glaberrima]|nr:transcription initiation factor TFIID subunit 15b isoform X1 [Oryza glaberrima]XP_052145197.1 transcription initiation factor TFIID subunit 15b isoform X1 [Oryza glaberrima]XP_052145199.1 transcription initiation factor TFIID subunit 15b isoform X1 [Oryza glaberrima]XP_052145200.1 transcription initiation factor TFIID subunit 15b isoform X1 [Oryza glaberrima]
MNRKPGDWDCRACQHLNFSRRDLCQRCGEPRGAADRGSGGGGDYANFGGRGGSSFGGGFGTGSDVRPGDWYCNCGAHNFASRSSCFKCAAFKDDAAVNSGGAGAFDGGDMSRSRGYGFGSGAARASRPGWKSGDWICTRSGCNEHNFASRMECFRCNAPRDSGSAMTYENYLH